MRRLRTTVLLVTLAAALFAGGASAFGVIDEPLPTGVVGQPYSYQFRTSGGNPPYTFTLDNGSLPPGLSLSSSGALTGTPTTPGSWNFFIEGSYSYNGGPPVYSQRQFTLNVIAGLAIEQGSLPVMVVGTPFSQQFTASGGGTQTWSVSAGALPAGLTFSTAGLLSGTPTAAGTSQFTLRVTDGTRAAQQAYTVEVILALTASAPTVPVAVVGSDFSMSLGASGGRSPYVWSLKSGVFPRGLTFDVNTGAIGGRPRVAGTSELVFTVTDTLANAVDVPVTITVQPRLRIPLQLLAPGRAGVVYCGKILVRGGAAPVVFEIAEGDLPFGMRLTRGGTLAGRPKAKGRYQFRVIVSDQLGNTHQRTFVLRIR